MSKVSQYTDTNQSEHELAIQTLARTLSHHKGKDNAISGKDLADRTPVSASTVRDLIPEVRQRYRMPVASCSKGYYRIESKDEFLEVMERIEGRISTAKERQREIARAWHGG